MKFMRTFLMSFGISLLVVGAVIGQGLPQIYAPLYGNWCGPNHPVNMSRAGPPVDPLDGACMRHDYCVAARGMYNCSCDIAFLQELRSTRWSNPQIQRNARAIYDAIALIPCDAPDGTAQKQTMFALDLLTDVIAGGGTPMDVLTRWQALVFAPGRPDF